MNARIVVAMIAAVLLLLLIVVKYAKLIPCAWCREPYAVFQRACGDLCWSCAGVYDQHLHRIARRRSVLRRIMGRAAWTPAMVRAFEETEAIAGQARLARALRERKEQIRLYNRYECVGGPLDGQHILWQPVLSKYVGGGAYFHGPDLRLHFEQLPALSFGGEDPEC